MLKLLTALGLLLYFTQVQAQPAELQQNNIIWTTQSQNSGESMPCGGGDIGLNVWVEKGDILFYLSKSGTFDENNTFLKLGRVRVKLSPNPFEGQHFRQELSLKDGAVYIEGSNGNIKANLKIWVDVFNPVVHVEVKSNKAIKTEAAYETWRFKDLTTTSRENQQGS